MSATAALAALLVIGSTQPLAAQRVARGPNFHKNTVKYSDAGAKPVSGRSGSASLQARALYGLDGSVLVEASTGSLDEGAGPGQIRKVQMKILSANGTPSGTQNFDGRGSGYWSTSADALSTKDRVQLQANIGGIDGNRNDVVTVSVPLQRRPDVAMDGVSAPGRVIAGTPMTVVATVSERNGDVGARGNCMLSIDGQLVDQARGIWVDAGQTVSCAFQTKLNEVGSHQVSVYVTGVSPLDWDPSDNSASTSVEILSPEKPLDYSASFKAEDYDYYSHSKKSSSDGSFLDETKINGTRKNRSVSMKSMSTEMFAFPVRVRSAILSDGASVYDYTRDIDVQASESTPTADCGTLMEDGYYLSVCNMRDGTPHSEVTLSSFGGRVTYLSSRFYQVDGADGYVINTSSDTPSGLGAYAVGSSIQSLVEVRDARGMLFAARPTMSLQATPINTQYNSCTFSRSSQLTTCSDGTSTGTARNGSASSGIQ
jgi:hypothetical protein